MWTNIRLLLKEQSDPELHCLLKRLQIFQQTTKAYDFCADQTNRQNLISLLGEEIAKPRPNMNIKVTAFIVTQKLYYRNIDEATGQRLSL